MSHILTKLEQKKLIERLPTRPLQIKITQKGKDIIENSIKKLKGLIPEFSNNYSNIQENNTKFIQKPKFIDLFISTLRAKVDSSLDSISQFLTKESLEALREDILETVSNHMYKIFSQIEIVPKKLKNIKK